MSAARILYRTRQLWQILRLAPTQSELEGARSVLAPALFEIFTRMSPGEQSHSLRVYSRLVENGEDHPDLMAAALLHDCGKTLYPLKLWERAWIVIGKALLPRLSLNWSQGELHELQRLAFWKRPFVVAERHPGWGADLASRAGASKQAVALIRRHQEKQPAKAEHLNPPIVEPSYIEDSLLHKLQVADNES